MDGNACKLHLVKLLTLCIVYQGKFIEENVCRISDLLIDFDYCLRHDFYDGEKAANLVSGLLDLLLFERECLQRLHVPLGVDDS